MIIGLGSDLCNIERIQNSLDRFGERFEKRVFTDVERAKAGRRPFSQGMKTVRSREVGVAPSNRMSSDSGRTKRRGHAMCGMARSGVEWVIFANDAAGIAVEF